MCYWNSCVCTSPGVKNADENELRSIASEPEDTHVYNVADFNVMSSIVEGLTKTVCEQVEQQDKDIKQSKNKKNWAESENSIFYWHGKEIVGTILWQISYWTLLTGNDHLYSFIVWLHPFFFFLEEKTGMPFNLATSEVTAQSFRVSWSPAPGNVRKYRVVYYPVQEEEPQEVNHSESFASTGFLTINLFIVGTKA